MFFVLSPPPFMRYFHLLFKFFLHLLQWLPSINFDCSSVAKLYSEICTNKASLALISHPFAQNSTKRLQHNQNTP